MRKTVFSTLVRIYCFFGSVVILIYLFVLNKKPGNLFITKDKKMRYILEWSYSVTYSGHFAPLWYTDGQSLFIMKNCAVKDCYITRDRSLFGDVTEFEAVIFQAPSIMRLNYFPSKRSIHQKYIFATFEPSEHTKDWMYDFHEYYNWTMTYKLDSDIPFPFMTIRDRQWNIIGPNSEMHWESNEEMKKTVLDESIKQKLQEKTKAAAWIVSNCKTDNKREKIVEDLQRELKKYELEIDIFGDCSKLKCLRKNNIKCLEMIKKHYFFYLAFENSFCEDYVTEKILKPLRYSAIPIVYGGANYTRFMPDGVYLDASKLGVEDLAQLMNELMQDQELYYDYFKWRNFYSYHNPEEHPDSDPFCQLCAKLHDDKLMKETKVYKNFIKWWNNNELVHKTHKSLVEGLIL